jgi:hypothetical protein
VEFYDRGISSVIKIQSMKINSKLASAIVVILSVFISVAIIEAIIYKSLTGLIMGALSLVVLIYCSSLIKKLRELE